MIENTCRCGNLLTHGEEELNTLVACPACGAGTTYACGEGLPAGSGAGDFDVAMVVIGGPARVGEQFALGGVADIPLGKMTDQLVHLLGHKVSRHHATLSRVDFGPSRWEIRDHRSTNGLFVNGERVDDRVLAIGDRVSVGEFTLEVRDASPVSVASRGGVAEALEEKFDGFDLAEEPAIKLPPAARVRPAAPSANRPAVSPDGTAGGATKACPRCKKTWPTKVKFCTGCGTDLGSGKRAVLAKDIDENQLYITAETVIRPLSFIMRIGVFPIASNALGGCKPITTWVITGVTALCSVLFMIAFHQIEHAEPEIDDFSDAAYVDQLSDVIVAEATHTPGAGIANLMLWSGKPATADDVADEYDTYLRQAIREDQPRATEAEVQAALKKAHEKIDKAVDARTAAGEGDSVGFRPYQLLTHAFLHDFSGWLGMLMHFGGNLLFLLVFGLRVNELIGQWRFALSYALVAIGAGLIHHVMSAHQPLAPMLGASGAIMGLAGMYLVLFPRQTVYTVGWLRLGLLTGFELKWRIWQMPGFWLLVAWIAWNDVLPMVLYRSLGMRDGSDGVAHWAHLGGFICGVVLASFWLLTRQVHAHGCDLISSLVGVNNAEKFVRQG